MTNELDATGVADEVAYFYSTFKLLSATLSVSFTGSFSGWLLDDGATGVIFESRACFG